MLSLWIKVIKCRMWCECVKQYGQTMQNFEFSVFLWFLAILWSFRLYAREVCLGSILSVLLWMK